MPGTVFRSEAVAWAASNTRNLDLSFLKDRGPNGGRLVVEGVYIRGSFVVDTNSTASIQGENLSSFISRLRIRDAEGELVNVSGQKLRLINILELGANAVADPADLAVSQTNLTINPHWYLPFATPRARRRWDFAVPVSHLKTAGGQTSGGAIEIQMPAVGDLNAGAAGTTIDSGNYTFYFFCREERDVEIHSRMEWRQITATSATDLYVPVNGGLLRALVLQNDGTDPANGGADISGVTAIDIQALDYSNIAPVAVVNKFAMEYDRGFTNDPFTAGTIAAIPVVFPRADGKLTDMYQIPGSLYIRLSGTYTTNPDLLYCVVTRRTPDVAAPEVAGFVQQHDRAPTAVIKTDKGTGRDVAGWKGFAKFMPAKLK